MGAKFLSHLDAGLVGVTQDLAEVAREASDFATMMDHNVQKMDTLLTSMEARVGKPIDINGESFPDAWAVIKFLADELERGEDVINEVRGAVKVVQTIPKVQPAVTQMRGFCAALLEKVEVVNWEVAKLDEHTTARNPMGMTYGYGPYDMQQQPCSICGIYGVNGKLQYSAGTIGSLGGKAGRAFCETQSRPDRDG